MYLSLTVTHHLHYLLIGYVHAAPGAQHLQQLTGHVPGDGLHKPKIYLDLPKMVEDTHNSHPGTVQLSVGQQAVDWEDLRTNGL